METRQCSACGIKETVEKGGWLRKWFSCPSCGQQLCEACAQKHDKEGKELQRLREGSAVDRIMILCPRCALEMGHIG